MRRAGHIIRLIRIRLIRPRAPLARASTGRASGRDTRWRLPYRPLALVFRRARTAQMRRGWRNDSKTERPSFVFAPRFELHLATAVHTTVVRTERWLRIAERRLPINVARAMPMALVPRRHSPHASKPGHPVRAASGQLNQEAAASRLWAIGDPPSTRRAGTSSSGTVARPVPPAPLVPRFPAVIRGVADRMRPAGSRPLSRPHPVPRNGREPSARPARSPVLTPRPHVAGVVPGQRVSDGSSPAGRYVPERPGASEYPSLPVPATRYIWHMATVAGRRLNAVMHAQPGDRSSRASGNTIHLSRSVLPVEVVYRTRRETMPVPAKPAPPPSSSAAAPPQLDVARLSQDVMRQIDKHLRVERERRGLL